MTAAKAKASRRGGATATTWLVRGAVGLLLGLALGAGAGVFAVQTLEPARGTGVDSLAVMLDSIARGRIASEDAPSPPQAPVDSAEPDAEAVDSVPVPSLVDLEEGAARNAIRDAGLQVGEVVFESNPKPAGTVLNSAPAVGSWVARGSAVTLTLSDGRPPETLFSLPLRP